MLKFVFLLYFINLHKISDAALGIITPVAKPMKFSSKPGCYLAEFDRMLRFGKSFYPRDNLRCVQYTCGLDGYINIATCGELMEGNCVRIKGNKEMKYPLCCDKIRCTRTHARQGENSTENDNQKNADNFSGENSPVENTLDDNSTAENPAVKTIDQKSENPPVETSLSEKSAVVKKESAAVDKSTKDLPVETSLAEKSAVVKKESAAVDKSTKDLPVETSLAEKSAVVKKEYAAVNKSTKNPPVETSLAEKSPNDSNNVKASTNNSSIENATNKNVTANPSDESRNSTVTVAEESSIVPKKIKDSKTTTESEVETKAPAEGEELKTET